MRLHRRIEFLRAMVRRFYKTAGLALVQCLMETYDALFDPKELKNWRRMRRYWRSQAGKKKK